jgi:pilus assembly protein CpaF
MIAGPRIRIDDRKSFQRLKTTLHRRIVDAIDLSQAPVLAENELRDQLRALAAHVCSREPVNLPSEVRETMVREIMDEIYGYGPLEPLLADPAVTDVLVNGPDSVRVERNGLLEGTDVRFADEAHLLRLIHRLIGKAGRRIDERSPLIDAQLPDGSRVTAIIPPLAVRGPTLSVRRRPSSVLQLEELVQRGTLAEEMAHFLIAAVRGRLNILISGGSGSGKTTLLNALGRFIPQNQRIVTIEDAAELRLEQPDVVSLEAQSAAVTEGGAGRGELTLRDLLKNSLRLRPDRIILGDARGGEVLELLQAMNTGHDGSMSTLHANDTRDALDRIELLVAMSGAELPLPAAREYIASAVQILIHVARLASGERKVVRISELRGSAGGQYQIEDLFVYRMAGCDESGRILGTFYSTGTEPASLMRLAALGVEVPGELFVPRELNGGVQYAEKGNRS